MTVPKGLLPKDLSSRLAAGSEKSCVVNSRCYSRFTIDEIEMYTYQPKYVVN